MRGRRFDDQREVIDTLSAAIARMQKSAVISHLNPRRVLRDGLVRDVQIDAWIHACTVRNSAEAWLK